MSDISKRLLLIFVKNTVLGTAKTRLAKSVGDHKALEIYKYLLKYTATITKKVNASIQVHYSTYIDKEDYFDNAAFDKHIQVQGDLGQKMKAAFEAGFESGYQQIVIIGSDCYELTTSILEQAFGALQQKDTVIGPAKDGGYYLLGMRQPQFDLFDNMNWSTATVFDDSLKKIKAALLSYHQLPLLSDIDYLEDLPSELRAHFKV